MYVMAHMYQSSMFTQGQSGTSLGNVCDDR